MSCAKIQKILRKLGSPKKALGSARFFKTGPGQYGEGDIFIGVTSPEAWRVAREFPDCSAADLRRLLASPVHEDRMVALMILCEQYARTESAREHKNILRLYLASRRGVNNWDLVDSSAHRIIGDYCLQNGDAKLMRKLARSKRHWDRRMAMVATLAFIRAEKLDLTFEFARLFLDESEDLMHKATGWMLREAGKRDLARLRRFIAQNGRRMPRTMLRYSIEKLSPAERKKILCATAS